MNFAKCLIASKTTRPSRKRWVLLAKLRLHKIWSTRSSKTWNMRISTPSSLETRTARKSQKFHLTWSEWTNYKESLCVIFRLLRTWPWSITPKSRILLECSKFRWRTTALKIRSDQSKINCKESRSATLTAADKENTESKTSSTVKNSFRNQKQLTTLHT